MSYHFAEIVVTMDVSYGEGNGQLYLRAQQTGPRGPG